MIYDVFVAACNGAKMHVERTANSRRLAQPLQRHGRTVEGRCDLCAELVVEVVLARGRAHHHVAGIQAVGQPAARPGADHQIKAGLPLQQMLRLKSELRLAQTAQRHGSAQIGQLDRRQFADAALLLANAALRAGMHKGIKFFLKGNNDQSLHKSSIGEFTCRTHKLSACFIISPARRGSIVRSNAHAWRACTVKTPSQVQILSSPPYTVEIREWRCEIEQPPFIISNLYSPIPNLLFTSHLMFIPNACKMVCGESPMMPFTLHSAMCLMSAGSFTVQTFTRL